MSEPGKRILVVRNDKLGDFMLSYPSLCLLKHALPDHEIHALVPSYTRPMAEACPWLDGVVHDPGPEAGVRGLRRLAASMRETGFAAAITLYSTTRIAAALALARIPYRLAPATKIAQMFYPDRLPQRRSRSEKPEYAYNVDLVRHFLARKHGLDPKLPGPPYLWFAREVVEEARVELAREHDVDLGRPVVFLHCGSGGSATNLTLGQYSELARTLCSIYSVSLVLTGGPAECERVRALSAELADTQHRILHSTGGLLRFAHYIAGADLFISGSTGPLHIAGALDVPTAAFYPRRRSSTALRWQTLNSASNRLAFSPPDSADESALDTIDVVTAAKEVGARFLAS